MTRHASLELLVRGLFGDDDDAPPPKKPHADTDTTKSTRRPWPWTPSAPAPEFVLC